MGKRGEHHRSKKKFEEMMERVKEKIERGEMDDPEVRETVEATTLIMRHATKGAELALRYVANLDDVPDAQKSSVVVAVLSLAFTIITQNIDDTERQGLYDALLGSIADMKEHFPKVLKETDNIIKKKLGDEPNPRW